MSSASKSLSDAFRRHGMLSAIDDHVVEHAIEHEQQPVTIRQQFSQQMLRHVMINNLRKASGKEVCLHGPLLGQHAQTITNWISAFENLRQYLPAATIFAREVKRVALGEPEKTEDAAWRGDGLMFLATKGAGYETRHMLNGLIHEIGHAYADSVGFVDSVPALYGQQPFVNDYAAKDPHEDFAETFLFYHVDPGLLNRVAKPKYLDMHKRMVKVA